MWGSLSAKTYLKARGLHLSQLNLRRGAHSRNKKAAEFLAQGFSAIKEVDRVIDYAEPQSRLLIPLLRKAKENFELALEVDNSNAHARYWLSRLHLKYHVPGQCKAIGAALLVEAADMGDAEAQYELGRRLRYEVCELYWAMPKPLETFAPGFSLHLLNSINGGPVINEYVQSGHQAFYYLEKAAEQMHTGALYLLAAIHMTGDGVKKDMTSALWCFHRASERGHAGAAIVLGSLILRGIQVPESLTKLYRTSSKNSGSAASDPVGMAKEYFQIAAKSGCELGFKWLQRVEEEEKQLLTE